MAATHCHSWWSWCSGALWWLTRLWPHSLSPSLFWFGQNWHTPVTPKCYHGVLSSLVDMTLFLSTLQWCSLLIVSAISYLFGWFWQMSIWFLWSCLSKVCMTAPLCSVLTGWINQFPSCWDCTYTSHKWLITIVLLNRCGNVAAILELDENLNKKFTVFEAAPQVSIMWQCCNFCRICMCFSWCWCMISFLRI